ncbi:Ff.00g075050.m01.CDS01 [Fusarium sp. VM40]|nr:Ff.00g075050.m01.CDS01 [Fusarium sp. VM40]
MPSTRPNAQSPILDADGVLDNIDTIRIPEPHGTYLQTRGARAARRIYKAMGVWPWDIVPEAPPKMWAINLLEDLALVADHVARNPGDTLQDLQSELRKSLARDRKPSYAGKLMAQDVHAAKKRFVRTMPQSPDAQDDTGDDIGTVERRSGRRRRTANYSAPDSPIDPSRSHRHTSSEESEELMASSITVASEFPPSPPVPRSVKHLKRPASTIPTPIEKRIRHSSPEGSRLSAAQSLMMFSSPMATFQMATSFGPNATASATRSLEPNNLQEALQPATNAFVTAIDDHVRTIRASLAIAQQEIFPHRTVHQEAMSKLRAAQDRVQAIHDDIAESQEKLRQLIAETAAEDALAPQLHALQENNMSLPPEIAQAIRSYDTRRAAKSEEIKNQETAISAKGEELKRATSDLEVAEKNSGDVESDIRDLQVAVTRGTEAARFASMFSVMVQLGPEGLANIEQIYPEIGSLLESLLASRKNPSQRGQSQNHHMHNVVDGEETNGLSGV